MACPVQKRGPATNVRELQKQLWFASMPAWFARMSAQFVRMSTYFPRGAVNRIFLWIRDTNLHSHYKAFPRSVEVLRASWGAINSSSQGESSVCLVSDVGGWIGRIWRTRRIVPSAESFSVRTSDFCSAAVTFQTTNLAGK